VIQYSLAHRAACLADLVSKAGPTAFFFLYGGPIPANCAAPDANPIIASIAMANPIGPTSSGGVQAITGPITSTVQPPGQSVPTHWRICTDSTGATCVAQGTVFPQVGLITNGATSPLGNVLYLPAVNQLALGMNVAGAGIPPGATIVDIEPLASSITISGTSVAGVPSGTAISFSGDLNMNGASVSQSQTIEVQGLTITATGA
jgi:hypothetical protein